MAKKRTTQAVVVIHGIGEQRPMSTLRGFVEAVLPQPESGPKFFSKPDRLGGALELRILQNRKQPRTRFFEYYWAYKVEGTLMRSIMDWVRTLLFRFPTRVPRHLLMPWILSWIIVGVLLMLCANCYFGFLSMRSSVASAIGVGLALLSQLFIVPYLGDAARYLDASPRNIALRRSIRADGVKLLKQIHESKEYDRVIVVGHSLGSVIAYDIVRQYWSEVYETYHPPPDANEDQPNLAKLEQLGARISVGDASPAEITEFQRAQNALWHELRELGHPWLVTDLITLGSPLGHAALLLARDEAEFRRRQFERELPCCPPIPDKPSVEAVKYSYQSWTPFPTSDGSKDLKLNVLHSAAPFACTRWTNLYFPAKLGLFGDLVASSLRPWFGAGIKDVPVTTRVWKGLAGMLPVAHVHYWTERQSRNTHDSLKILIESLNFDPGEEE